MEKKKGKYRIFQLSHELGDKIDFLQAATTLSEKKKLNYEELIEKIVVNEFERLEKLKNENKV
jgi:hypothetical protein